jgi:hypothetical protein
MVVILIICQSLKNTNDESRNLPCYWLANLLLYLRSILVTFWCHDFIELTIVHAHIDTDTTTSNRTLGRLLGLLMLSQKLQFLAHFLWVWSLILSQRTVILLLDWLLLRNNTFFRLFLHLLLLLWRVRLRLHLWLFDKSSLQLQLRLGLLLLTCRLNTHVPLSFFYNYTQNDQSNNHWLYI